MILEDFITISPVGLYCVYGDFYLDPLQPVKEAVVSHAHGDHAIGGSQHVYCTAATAAFMKHRYRKFAAVDFFTKHYHQSFQLKEVTVTFYPAGHILGSAQVLMEYKGVKYLYTGDYKIEPDKTCEAFEFVEADVLITESTFADPETKHPSPVDEIKKLNETRANIMLGAYALGKSQRIIQLLNDHCPTRNVMVHFSIMPFVKIYEDYGIKLGNYSMYDRKVMKNNHENQVYIVPPMVFHSYHKAINVVRAFASGWKNLQQQNGISLYISDHADWEAILETISKVKPKQVWTLHGDGKQLKDYFKNKLEVKILN
ncbi:MBL fold metallo-hydrolase [Pedobacter zeae]|uniref:DNA ligase-associated DEXH box helicase n=1 Tax=Pedobacter zeae TaxID=1737356 RepID=A0A7W6P4U7_9SPHI|nr:MBL fold metallo-hydrolase [Pedobacter zeae]MBB4106296.1 putative mRNA 3-end processing factor [Pedobacter zeae]GGH00767.1 DNA ligase-associated DEXH box helicase [Pedobacter zeae]